MYYQSIVLQKKTKMLWPKYCITKVNKVLYNKSKQNELYYRSKQNVWPLYYKSKQRCMTKVLYYKSKQTKVLYYKSKQRCVWPKYCITKVNKDVWPSIVLQK